MVFNIEFKLKNYYRYMAENDTIVVEVFKKNNKYQFNVFVKNKEHKMPFNLFYKKYFNSFSVRKEHLKVLGIHKVDYKYNSFKQELLELDVVPNILRDIKVYLNLNASKDIPHFSKFEKIRNTFNVHYFEENMDITYVDVDKTFNKVIGVLIENNNVYLQILSKQKVNNYEYKYKLFSVEYTTLDDVDKVNSLYKLHNVDVEDLGIFNNEDFKLLKVFTSNNTDSIFTYMSFFETFEYNDLFYADLLSNTAILKSTINEYVKEQSKQHTDLTVLQNLVKNKFNIFLTTHKLKGIIE